MNIFRNFTLLRYDVQFDDIKLSKINKVKMSLQIFSSSIKRK